MNDFIDVVILHVRKPEIPPFSMVSENQDGILDARRARATCILSFFLIFFKLFFNQVLCLFFFFFFFNSAVFRQVPGFRTYLVIHLTTEQFSLILH